MPTPDLSQLSVLELLTFYDGVLEELVARGAVRGTNNPVADYSEALFCTAFGWRRNPQSQAGHDGVDAAGVRYEVKGRRLTARNPSRQLSAMRRLDTRPFDVLAGVLYQPDFIVHRAALVPYEVVLTNAAYVQHTNSWRFMLRDAIWAEPGVRDVTDELRAVRL